MPLTRTTSALELPFESRGSGFRLELGEEFGDGQALRRSGYLAEHGEPCHHTAFAGSRDRVEGEVRRRITGVTMGDGE